MYDERKIRVRITRERIKQVSNLLPARRRGDFDLGIWLGLAKEGTRSVWRKLWNSGNLQVGKAGYV